MFCSPIHLLNDMALWHNPFLFNMLAESYRNYTTGNTDTYDCAMTSAPCESNLTKKLIFSEPTFVYWFDIFIVYVGLTVFSFVGIVGNVVNIVIISRNNIANDSTNNLYLWLSISDLVTALNCCALVMVCFLCYIDDSLALSAFNMTFPYLFGNINKISLLSLDFVTVISVQRVVAIVFPFKISRIFSYRNTNILIAFFILIGILSNMPLYAGQHPLFVFHPYFGKVISVGYAFTIGFNFAMNFLTITFYTRSVLDLVVIFVAISLTIYKLNRQGESRSKMIATTTTTTSFSTNTTSTSSSSSSSSSDKKKTTATSAKSAREVKVIKMSISVCVITFVIFCFNIVVSTILQVYSDRLYQTPVPFATNNGGLLLNAIGASFNFFLYLVMSAQYRNIFTNMFGIRKKL